MFKDKENQTLRAKAWESTVRKAQQQQRRRFFSPMSVAPADDDSDSSSIPAGAGDIDGENSASDGDDYDEISTSSGAEEGEEKLYHAERLLPSGDYYNGKWFGSVGHGTGKYLWTDGCMYEGEWRQGKTTGRGKFSWLSGATYEGEFKAGFMDGMGTLTGVSGDTYRGLWSMNLKHGNGKQWYANGDIYDGEWRSGLLDGNGRYLWKNGCEYVGQWRGGVMQGKGTFRCLNGDRYDGNWDGGFPQGNGKFQWSDGSLYVGVWSRDGMGVELSGVYYPAPGAGSPTARDPQETFGDDLRECKVGLCENMSILPSQKKLNWSGVEEWMAPVKGVSDPGFGYRLRRRASVDINGGRLPPRKPNGRIDEYLAVNENGQRGAYRMRNWDSDGGDFDCDVVEGRRSVDVAGMRLEEARMMGVANGPQVPLPPRKVAKKQGEAICRGHKNYELMLNLQLGIRHAAGKQGPINFELKSSAFDPKEKVWTKFPPEGSKHTPPHQSCDFKWKDYCPQVFRTLRKLFKVDAADYMLSLCGNDALRELCSPGKSGSFFYLTNDDRYMIKTMKKSEVKVLVRMLPAYYNHVRLYENTLVTKFFGLHCVKLSGSNQKKVRFVIMGNLFCSEYPIHRRFDLKGSSHGRTTRKPESEIDENTTLKDLDLNFIFRLKKSWFQEFQRQVDKDCEFLEQERIMDYSLLVGLHFIQHRSDGNTDNINEGTPHHSNMDLLLNSPNRLSKMNLGVNMPARTELTVRRNENELQLIGEPTGKFYDVILFFGIIDILQDYDISKKLEHAYKSIQYDPTSISAVDPRQYSRRFRDFIYRAFSEDT